MKKGKIPPPALPLGDLERKMYASLAKFLQKHNAWQEVDTYIVSQLAWHWGRYRIAVEVLQDPAKMIQVFDSGAMNVSAWYTIADRESTSIMKLCKELGLTQRSREAILAFKADANEPGGLISKLQAIREQSKKRI